MVPAAEASRFATKWQPLDRVGRQRGAPAILDDENNAATAGT